MLETAFADQAAGLRRMAHRPGLRVLPVAGGANSTERSLALMQLAVAVADEGHAVIVLDQSKGETARALGAHPRYDLLHVLEGEKTLAEVAIRGNPGLRLVSASRGIARLAHGDGHGTDLFTAFVRMPEPAELVLFNVETPEVAARVLPAGDGEVLLVVSPSRESITGTYAHVKQLARARGLFRYRLMIVDAADPAEGEEVARHVAGVSRRFLGVQVLPGAVVLRDPRWRAAAGSGDALVLRDPNAASSRVLRHIAAGIAGWQLIEVAASVADTRLPS